MCPAQPPEPGPWVPRAGLGRVLVECPEEDRRAAMVAALESEGHEVLACPGPAPEHGWVCPALEGGRCLTAAHADVVLVDFHEEVHATVRLPGVVAHELRAGASVIVQIDRAEAYRHRDALAGCRILYRPVTRRDLVQAVTLALDDLAATPVVEPGRTGRPKWFEAPGRR